MNCILYISIYPSMSSRQIKLQLVEPAKRKCISMPDYPYDEKELLRNADLLVLREISKKLDGYKSQDKKHVEDGKFCELMNTPSCEDTCKMLLDCDLVCYYCRKQVKVLYDRVKDPRQWTLERIDNTIGHIDSNVVIACLSCNLGRRTIFHKRYAFTKQFASNVVKNEGSG